jgi:hypothetical protein
MFTEQHQRRDQTTATTMHRPVKGILPMIYLILLLLSHVSKGDIVTQPGDFYVASSKPAGGSSGVTIVGVPERIEIFPDL